MNSRLTYTRREFGKLALATVPASALFADRLSAQAKINSTIKGVQIGAITYSFNRIVAQGGVDAIINAYIAIGLGEMEIMSNHAEALVGAPTAGRGGRRGTPPTPEQEAALKARNDWRAAATDATFKPVRDKIQNAGIDLRVLCYNVNTNTSDADLEYGFRMAKALGVRAMSTSTQVSMGKRLAPLAEKYKMPVGFHGHDSVEQPDEIHNEASFKAIMAISSFFNANLDVGHFTAAGGDAVDFIRKYHDRITNLHFKDMRRNEGNSYTPFGQGHAPLKEVLLLVSREKYNFPVNIEFEYQGDPLVEVPKCFQYIKDALA